MMLFKVLCASFRENKEVYNRGDFVESARDLCAFFPGKFDLVRDDPTPSRPRIASVVPPSSATGGVSKKAPPVVTSKRSKKNEELVKKEEEVMEEAAEPDWRNQHEGWADVTEEFPAAEPFKVSVMFDGDVYHVVNQKDGSVLNGDEKLDKAKAVRLFLKNYSEE